MMDVLKISPTLLQEMIDYVDGHAPLEACGLLAGRVARVEKMVGITNQAQSEVRFVMDPYEQLRAFDWIESQGLELLGIFHSHPSGPETASSTDIAEAAYDVVHVILSRRANQWQARGFWIEGEAAREVTLELAE